MYKKRNTQIFHESKVGFFFKGAWNNDVTALAGGRGQKVNDDFSLKNSQFEIHVSPS